jgi:hypothetical protein
MIKEIFIMILKIVLIIIGFFTVLIFIVLFPYIINNEYGKIIIGILLLPTIYILFKLRKNNKNMYGLIEIMIGSATLLSIIYNPTINTTSGINDILKLFGGVYISIRGLDNFEKGLKTTKNKNIWEKIFGKIM